MSKTEPENKSSKEPETEETDSDSISNVHRELAVKAAECFDKRDFAESLSHLVKLQEQRPLDARFTHNAAVVEFFASGLKNVSEFENKLNSVCCLSEINLDNIDSLDDIRNCCIYFNKAVLLYHTMQYSSAMKILHKEFSLIESMDEELRQAVCSLLIELFLCVHQSDKALSVITYLENLPKSDAPNIKSITENDSEHSDSKNTNENVKQKVDVSESLSESFKTKLHMYKCRSCLDMCNLKACENELENFCKNYEKVVIKSGCMNDEVYEARCHNLKCCAKFLKAYAEYLKGSLKSCVQILSTIPLKNNFNLTGDSIPLTYYNNMGCAHMMMGKSNLASLYFRKALQENTNNVNFENTDENESNNRLLFTYGSNKLPELMYNLGVSLLHSGKATEAFDCLTLAAQVYHMNPRLWLRLAECCIMVHKNSNERDFDFINKRKDILQEVIGTGIHRKLILNLNLFQNIKYSYDAQSFAIPVASLEFATLCLRNALLLLSGPTVDCAPSNPITQTQITNLRATVLVCSAYVSLCLGDPIVALNSCKNLLSIPNCSGINKLLGHLYIAEAFILLDRIPEALEHLKPDYSNYMLPNDKETPVIIRSWKPDNSASTRAVFQHNLAVVLALKGDLQKAAELLKQVWLTKGPQCEIPVQIISLALYIELSLGHADVARNIIKQNCPHYNNPS